MAVLQKIRSKGTLLIVIIGLALFAFIAGDFFNSIEATSNDSKQQIGEVNGKKLSAKDYQALIDEYTEVLKFTRNVATLSDEEMDQIKDQVWQTYVNYELVKGEADKLGLTVTDEEMANVIKQGTNPLLSQTPFKNEKTGQFDFSLLNNFLKEYKEVQTKSDQEVPAEYKEYYQKLYNFWMYTEKSIRQNLLMEKYQVLLGKSLISNPISAKMSFEGRNTSSNILLAAIPYNTVSDNEVKVTDSDLKAMYDRKKEMFRQYIETRDIKYVSVAVVASPKDKAELNKEMNEYAQQLLAGQNAEDVVRNSGSVVNYSTLPISKRRLPSDVQSRIDSLSIGGQKGPYYNASDNTMNIVKLIATAQVPDSVQYRVIQVPGKSLEGVRASADSIQKAIQGGAPFEEVAKKYGQKGESQWLTSAGYENARLDENTIKNINTILHSEVNVVINQQFPQGNLIVQVLDRRNIITKYNAAIIKRTVDFSKETYAQAYNAFSHFVAGSKTLAEVEANAGKNGYQVGERKDLSSAEHNVANVGNTKEAMRWIFAAKEGELSPLYECGNNDHLLLVALTKIHKEGYRSLDDVKDILRQMVLNEKKGQKLMALMKPVKTMAQALTQKGVVVDTLKNVTFANPVYVSATATYEPKLNGSVWHKKANQFAGPIQGEKGVYVYQVLNVVKGTEKYNEQNELQMLNQMNMRAASNLVNDLYIRAKVKDKRYLFF